MVERSNYNLIRKLVFFIQVANFSFTARNMFQVADKVT